jgi:hypothetical protein
MAWKKLTEGVAIGAGLAIGLLAVVVVVNTFAPAVLSSQRAAIFGR